MQRVLSTERFEHIYRTNLSEEDLRKIDMSKAETEMSRTLLEQTNVHRLLELYSTVLRMVPNARYSWLCVKRLQNT